MIAYKVVFRDNKNRLTSVVMETFKKGNAPSRRYAIGVYYFRNRWVTPHKNRPPLMVFRTLQDAKRYVATMWWGEIWKCKIKKSTQTVDFGITPGTVFADKVKLLEKV